MATLYKRNGKFLRRGGKFATSADCCCCCCKKGPPTPTNCACPNATWMNSCCPNFPALLTIELIGLTGDCAGLNGVYPNIGRRDVGASEQWALNDVFGSAGILVCDQFSPGSDMWKVVQNLPNCHMVSVTLWKPRTSADPNILGLYTDLQGLFEGASIRVTSGGWTAPEGCETC